MNKKTLALSLFLSGTLFCHEVSPNKLGSFAGLSIEIPLETFVELPDGDEIIIDEQMIENFPDLFAQLNENFIEHEQQMIHAVGDDSNRLAIPLPLRREPVLREIQAPPQLPPLPIHQPSIIFQPPLPNYQGMLYVPPDDSHPSNHAFFINMHPVSNLDYSRFINATKYHPPSHWMGGKLLQGTESDPIVNITYNDAYTYAVWAGKRLPTENEWIRASQILGFHLHDDRHLNEWTSTPFYHSYQDHQPHPHFKTIMGNALQDSHPFYKHDCNCYTSFRVAIDSVR